MTWWCTAFSLSINNNTDVGSPARVRAPLRPVPTCAIEVKPVGMRYCIHQENYTHVLKDVAQSGMRPTFMHTSAVEVGQDLKCGLAELFNSIPTISACRCNLLVPRFARCCFQLRAIISLFNLRLVWLLFIYLYHPVKNEIIVSSMSGNLVGS